MEAERCTRCGASSPAGSRYCGECGAPFRDRVRVEASCAVHPDVPATKSCPRCGTFACAQCLRPVPGEEDRCVACEARAPHLLLPWDERAQVGLLRAFWGTCTLLLRRPGVTLERAQPHGSLGSSLLFVVMAAFFGSITSVIAYAGFALSLLLWLPTLSRSADAAGDRPSFLLGVLGGAAGFQLLVVIWAVVSALAFSAMEHGVLKLAGARPASWEVTFRAHALSHAPYLIGLVPVCGAYVFVVWSLVVRILALKGLHQTRGGKAALAVLLPTGALWGALIALYAALVLFRLGG